MKFLRIALFFIGVAAFSQSKVGVLDLEFVVSQMPEITSVQENLELYANQLDFDFDKKVEEYNTRLEEFKSRQSGYSEEKRKEEQQALLNMDEELEKFQSNGMRLIEIKRQEYMRPLYQQIGTALEKVAREHGFTQVLHLTDEVLFLDPEYDLTLPVLDEMGISLKEEASEE